MDCDEGVTCADIPTEIDGVYVTRIGNEAFSNCASLTNVTIPEGVTSIAYRAFYECRSLSHITVPGSAIDIGDEAFCECYGLSTAGPIGGGYSFEFGWTDEIPENAFTGNYRYWSGWLKSITIPDSITSIGDGAFAYCSMLTSITIPGNVTNIGNSAFHCSGLTSVIIPDSVTKIGDGAFRNCSGLADITISSNITCISENTFYGCIRLTHITIRSNITSIGRFAFYNCNSLTDVYYSGSEAEWRAISISSLNQALTNATIHYNHTGPDINYIVPKGKYLFHVVDQNGYDLPNVTATWNDKKAQTDSDGLVSFDLFTEGTPVVRAELPNYTPWTNANSNWSKSSNRYETIILYPAALGQYKLTLCRYSNSSLMTFDTDLLTVTKTVSLGNDIPLAGDLDFGTFYVSCGTGAPLDAVDYYELWQGKSKIAEETSGFSPFPLIASRIEADVLSA